MNLFELFIKIGLDDQASKNLSSITGKLGNGLKTAAKIGTAAVSAAAAGITALTTAAVNNYAEYEQLVGGVETLFKNSADTVMEYASEAYKTAGMSANEYMSTVTSFSASLLQGLGGDTEKAAKVANRAITDMSDNANKMGTSIEMIQNAYQGFAKQNYTMLDNLKLGYGGTASEMARLINDSGVLGENIKVTAKTVNSVSFAKIIEAIGVVQDRIGITGTTAKEAGATISGSVGAMKSAWKNLVTGLADSNADVGELVGNLVTTIVGDGTDSNLGVLGNILPAVETAFAGVSTLIAEALPPIIELVPEIIMENLPILAGAAVAIIQGIVDSVNENHEMLFAAVIGVLEYLVQSFITMAPQIMQLGLDLLISLANGIAQNLATLIPAITETILMIVGTLTSPEMLTKILDAALLLIVELSYGMMDAIPQLVNACIMIIEGLTDFLTRPENIGKLLLAAAQIVIALGTGIVKAIPQIQLFTRELSRKVIENFKNADWEQIGRDLVAGFKSGILRAWTNLKKWFKNLFGDLIGIAKKILGIASPSKVFKKLGGFTAEGFGIGFDDEFESVRNDMEDAMDFTSPDSSFGGYVGTMSGYTGGGYGGNTFGNINITINGAKYTDEESLANAIAEKIQMMTERRSAVYA